MQIFWFPYAGAHASSYRAIQHHLPPDTEHFTLELPGHGMRIREPLLRDIHAMRDHLLSAIIPKLKSPYVFYGHSMGAVLAYLCTAAIAQKGLSLPKHLFLSGRAAPSVEPARRNRHLLSDHEFTDMLHELGGSPREVLEHQELMALMLPVLRADFEAIENFRPGDREPLPVPMTTLNGTDDVREEQAKLWQNETSLPLEMHQFPGGHFFIFEQAANIAGLIRRTLFRV